jgi:predicted CXXCH cytochrome family protein
LSLADEIEYLFPSEKQRITKAPSGLFKLLLRSSGKREVYLLQPDSIKFSVSIASDEEKDNFPEEMYTQFGETFAIATIDLKFMTGTRVAEELGYNFSTDRPLDIEDFWRTTDFRRILGHIDEASAPELEITMHGWQIRKWILNPRDEPAHLDLIGASVNLTPGENLYTLQVRTGDYELVLTDTLSFYYFFSYLADSPPESFSRFDFHTEEIEPKCGQCHQEMEDNDCSFCHASVVEQEFAHEPAEDMDCTACHDESDYPKYELMEDFRDDPEACLMCHSDIEEIIGEVENVHPPVEESCMICHDPHSAANPFMIPVRTKELCMNCHDDIKEGFHPQAGHPLERDQDPRKEKLLHLDFATLCSECHMKN